MAKCPFCGGAVVRTGHDAGGGIIEESACCWTPMELIDNYDVFSALPKLLQKLAIEGKKAEHQALYDRWNEEAKRFAEWEKESKRRWPHLFVTDRKEGQWQ